MSKGVSDALEGGGLLWQVSYNELFNIDRECQKWEECCTRSKRKNVSVVLRCYITHPIFDANHSPPLLALIVNLAHLIVKELATTAPLPHNATHTPFRLITFFGVLSCFITSPIFDAKSQYCTFQFKELATKVLPPPAQCITYSLYVKYVFWSFELLHHSPHFYAHSKPYLLISL